MKLITSIRHQVLMLLISFSIGLTLLYLSSAVISAFVVEDTIIHKLLKQQANYVENYYQQHQQLPKLDSGYIQLFEDVSHLPEWAQQGVQKKFGDNEIFTPDEKHFHYRKLNLANGKNGYLLAEVSFLLAVTNQPAVFEIFLFGLILALFIATFLAFRFSRKITEPVMALINAVKEKKQPNNQTQLPKLKYELGYLSDTLEQTFATQEKILEREKAFTTDVSHELRTPLTVLNNTLILAQQRGITEADINDLEQVSRQMHNTIEVLLALARAESLEKQPCKVQPIIEQILVSAASKQTNIDVNLDISEQFVVTANPTLLRLLFQNLIENAINHASDNKLIISQQQNQLSFSNGTSQALTANPIEPGVKSEQSQGVGQGLYLVTRIIESSGWGYQLIQQDNQFKLSIIFE